MADLRIITPGIALPDVIAAPPSKSHSQRALLAAAMGSEPVVLQGVGRSKDEEAMLGVVQALGAKTEKLESDTWQIAPQQAAPAQEFFFGESGLALRMSAPVIAAKSPTPVVLQGSGSLCHRPMGWLSDVLPRLGTSVEHREGMLPIRMSGLLQPADIRVAGGISSQFLSGLLFAFAAVGKRPFEICVSDAVSTPYLALSRAVLQDFGYAVGHEHFQRFVAGGHKLHPAPETYHVEGDWSAGAMLLAGAASLGRAIRIQKLEPESLQADRAIVRALELAGCAVTLDAQGCHMEPSAPLRAFEFDISECPDLAMPLAVLASSCEGTSVIMGAARLVHKESNRVAALQDVFEKMGLELRSEKSGAVLLIRGGAPIGGVEVSSYHDHRVAMCAALLALRATAPVRLLGWEAVAKSYPRFFEDLGI